MKRLRQWWIAFRNLEAAARLSALQTELAAERHQFQEQIHLLNLEIEDLKRRLGDERARHDKTKGHVGKLWSFIAIRHRLDTPPENGTIRKLLMEVDGQR